MTATFLAVLLSLLTGAANAAGPDPEAFEPMTEFQTWYANFGDGAVLRIDAAGPYITLDGNHFRFHFDGVDVWYQDRWDPFDPDWPLRADPPVKLPPVIGSMVQDFWKELRSGFAGTSFTPETPPYEGTYMGSNSLSPGWRWYRMRLPFSWDDKWLVYLLISESTARPDRALSMMVLNGDGQPALLLPAAIGQPRVTWKSVDLAADFTSTSDYVALNVPLGPDAYHPDQYSIESGDVLAAVRPLVTRRSIFTPNLNYHDALRVAWLPYDEAASDGWVAAESFAAPGFDATTNCAHPGELKAEGTLLWRFPEGDANGERVAEALAACGEVRFQMRPQMFVESIPGARACLKGTWEVLDLTPVVPSPEPAVLWSTSIDVCRQGPAREEIPFLLDAALLGPVTGPDLAIRFTGGASVTCHASENASGRVKTGSKGVSVTRPTQVDPTAYAKAVLSTENRAGPLLWWDCWPGWDLGEPSPWRTGSDTLQP